MAELVKPYLFSSTPQVSQCRCIDTWIPSTPQLSMRPCTHHHRNHQLYCIAIHYYRMYWERNQRYNDYWYYYCKLHYNNSTSSCISSLSGADDCDDDAYMHPIDSWGVDGIIQVSMPVDGPKKGMREATPRGEYQGFGSALYFFREFLAWEFFQV